MIIITARYGLDKHAPQRLRFITLRPHAPWFDDELRSARQAKRRFERKWKTSGLEIDKQIFKEQCECDAYTSLINEATYYLPVTSIHFFVKSTNLPMVASLPYYRHLSVARNCLLLSQPIPGTK